MVNKIDSKSKFAGNLYRAIIRASRKKDKDWFQRAQLESSLMQSMQSNELATSERNRNYFSFGEPKDFRLLKADDRPITSTMRNKLTESLQDYLPERDVSSNQSSAEKGPGLTLENFQQALPERDTSRAVAKESRLSAIRASDAIFGDDLSKVYRNRYLTGIDDASDKKGKRATAIADELGEKAHRSISLGLSAIIQNADLSPIRDQEQERIVKFRESHSEDPKKDPIKFSSAGYRNKYLNQSQSTQPNEFTVLTPHGVLQSSNRKFFSSRDRADGLRSSMEQFDEQQTRTTLLPDSARKSVEVKKVVMSFDIAFFSKELLA